MKSRLIILGCGSSIGTPRIDGYWGKCDSHERKNIRSRCSALIVKGSNNILIDTSPDLRQQLLSNKITKISSVLFTHEHADQTNGLFELRPFFWKYKKKINIFGNKFTINSLKKSQKYLFKENNSYPAIVKDNLIKKNFSLGQGKSKILFKSINLKHGYTKSIAYIFEKIAYLSDCKDFSILKRPEFRNLNCLVIDCLKFIDHPSHFNLDECIKIHKSLKPKKTILTNLHYDLDYKYLVKNLPSKMFPAYDGLSIKI
tara:strand:- start:63 stop:833 length:771 start_codon:yes stop_codon:yes gene_type:complete